MPTFKSWYAPLFFGTFLLFGLLIVDDYGISWDEAIQRQHGRVSLDYLAERFGGADVDKLEPAFELGTYQWANYGMLYQIPANYLEQWLGWEDSTYHYYWLRHLLCFLLFWVASIYFYRTLRLRFPDQDWYPLLGTAALILSPRIFANAFYNPKDHILLVFYLISCFTLLRLLKHRTWRNLLWHAVATGLALNTRLPAAIVLLATVLLFSWEFLREKPRRLRNLGMMAAYAPASLAVMVCFFPYLWEDTLNRLAGAFTEMSAFDWDSYVWLFGDMLRAMDLPAYYIPAWIAITTPIIYLLFILTGLFAFGHRLVNSLTELRLWRNDDDLLDFTQLGLSVGPILVIVLLGSTLYNGWRHLYFVYPGFVYLMMVGYHYARQHPKRKRIATGVLLLGLVTTAAQVVRYHPHQFVYFNEAIRHPYRMTHFDMDYWGVGFRQAFLQLAEQIPEGETRKVKCQVWPCNDNYYALPAEAKAKLVLEDKWHLADYLAINFHDPNNRNGYLNRLVHFAYPIVEIEPAGHITIGIYNIKQAAIDKRDRKE